MRIRSIHRFTAHESMNGMVSWPVSRSVGRLVDGMVDWAVWLVVIGGWRRQIILSYKITNNIIGVLRANSLVARWPGVCIVYRTSQHDRCGAPLGPFGFVFVFRKNVFRFYFYWFGFFLISLFVLFKKSFLGPRGDCGGMRPTGHKHSPGCGCPGATYKDRDHGTTPQNTLAGLQHCWTYCCLVRAFMASGHMFC